MLKTLTKINTETLQEINTEKALRKTRELFLLFGMGSQFDHLIKQKLDTLGVFCLVADPKSITANDIKTLNPTGIILSGGPSSAYHQLPFDNNIFNLNLPILGICLGFQMWAHYVGAKVKLSAQKEFGVHDFFVLEDCPLFKNTQKKFKVLESHGDSICLNQKIKILGKTENAPVSAGNYKNLWGVQFHPEVSDTEFSDKIFSNFVFNICKAKDVFPAKSMAEQKISELQNQIKNKKTLLALSGGVDSSIVAYLLKKVYPNFSNLLRGIYIKGIDRPDDELNVIKYFGNNEAKSWLDLKVVDATQEFIEVLQGKFSMHDKRIAMRTVYKKILEKEAKEFGAEFLAQGTLYTDVSESGGGYITGAKKAQIKIHHNVNLNFEIEELQPLIDCVKDTGRQIGRQIGVPDEILLRHPFPGPGLIVRIENEVTKEKLSIARQADGIFIEELKKWNLYDKVWQAGAVVTNSKTTCTKGDDSAEGCIVALWAVWSVNGFTARVAELPFDFLKKVSQKITNQIREVGGVVYRISDKPPVTIEWG
jgi:GMP synthase (glutamine-hydrolysing)